MGVVPRQPGSDTETLGQIGHDISQVTHRDLRADTGEVLGTVEDDWRATNNSDIDCSRTDRDIDGFAEACDFRTKYLRTEEFSQRDICGAFVFESPLGGYQLRRRWRRRKIR